MTLEQWNQYQQQANIISQYQKWEQESFTLQQMKLAFEYGKTLKPFDSFEDFIKSLKQNKKD